MTERQIDEAIDAAVRDLMNVDADPAFRARVSTGCVSRNRASALDGASCRWPRPRWSWSSAWS